MCGKIMATFFIALLSNSSKNIKLRYVYNNMNIIGKLVNHEKSNKIRVMEDWFSMKNAFACSCVSTFSCQTYLENIWLEEVEVRIVQHMLQK